MRHTLPERNARGKYAPKLVTRPGDWQYAGNFGMIQDITFPR